jgi:hypothetical protein
LAESFSLLICNDEALHAVEEIKNIYAEYSAKEIEFSVCADKKTD